MLSLIHMSEPTRQAEISYAVVCLKKKKKKGGHDSNDGLFESAIYPTLDKLLAQSGGICGLDGARRERPR